MKINIGKNIMKFNTKQDITDEIEKFINQAWIKEWLKKGMFINIYKELIKEKMNVGKFTHWLYDLGIDPLSYGLTEVPESFLEGEESLIEIHIPAKIKKIGESAFYGCTQVKEIIIPRNVEEIEGWSLAHMKGLKEITIEGKLKNLNSLGIYDNDHIETIYSIPANKELINMNVSEIKAGTAKFVEI